MRDITKLIFNLLWLVFLLVIQIWLTVVMLIAAYHFDHGNATYDWQMLIFYVLLLIYIKRD